jgi:lysyl-tRNA synthetase class 2
MTRSSPWWDQDVYADRRPFLSARRKITAATRQFYDSRGFSEVETSILQYSGGNETHISAFATELISASGSRSQLYLNTSPEFACKKLLSAGESKIYTLARAFRNRERTPLHHPEFTMLEWYRAGAGAKEAMADCAQLLTCVADTAQAKKLVWREMSCDPHAAPERLTVCEAFKRYVNIDLETVLEDRAKLAEATHRIGLRVSLDDNWSDLFSKILSQKIECELGRGRPTFLVDYPLSEAALAQAKADDPRFADRFEFYVCGVELANGFVELTDGCEQRRRFKEQMAKKKEIYAESYPIDEDFILALAQMPAASGVALGFDRLVMLATQAERIEQVLWTPVVECGSIG